MELFAECLLVRLRSRARGKYLRADGDGVSVSLQPHRASASAAWVVRRVQSDGGAKFFLLRSAASGRSLALSPSPAPPGRRGRRGRCAIQLDAGDEADPRGLRWKAARAGDGGGHVFLRNACFRWNLRAAGWDRSWHNGVAADDREGATAHWMVEAALPPSPAPPYFPATHRLPKVTSIRVPRLSAETITGAMLPVLGERNVLIGYVAAGSVLGLAELLEGTGEVLRAGERVLKAALGGDRLPDGLSALAFLAGRGGGMQMLPLLVLPDDAARDDGVGDEVVPPDNAEERPGEGHGADADAGVFQHEDDPLDAGELVGAGAAVVLDGAGGGQEDLPVQAAAAAGNQEAGAVVANAAAAQDVESQLRDAYAHMERQKEEVRRHLREMEAIEAAAKDWSSVSKALRPHRQALGKIRASYNLQDAKATKLRLDLVTLGAPALDPPPALDQHIDHLLADRL